MAFHLILWTGKKQHTNKGGPRSGQAGNKQGRNNGGSERRCWNCAETGHIDSSCRHRTKVTCHQCHKLGHKQKFCDLF